MSRLLEKLAKDVDCIELDNSSKLTVHQVRNALATINIVLTDSEIVNKIIFTFSQKQGYVSILPLSQKVKISLPEVLRLLDMGKAELNAFKFLLGECLNNPSLRENVNILKLEVQITGEVTCIGNSHKILDELHEQLELLFLRKYRNIAFRAGYKKLIIKSALASSIYGTESDM